MSLGDYKNKALKDIYAQKLSSSFMLGNKYVIDPQISQGSIIKIKFISPISLDLEALIEKISFSCASCGGPDKARITIEIGIVNKDERWFISDIKGCSIAYKNYNSPWRGIKEDMFTDDLQEWTKEVFELLLE